MGDNAGASVYELRRVSAVPEAGSFPSDGRPDRAGDLSQRSSSPQHVDHLVDDSRVGGVNSK